MSGLVKDVVDLEAEADAVIEKARAEARELDRAVKRDIASYQDRVGTDLDARVQVYREEAEARHARMMADARDELERALRSLERVPEGTLRAQVDRILERCRSL